MIAIDDHPPAFQAIYKGQIYRICVTSSDLLFVQLRARHVAPEIPWAAKGGAGCGLLGWFFGSRIDEALEDGRGGVVDFETQVEEEEGMLDQ